jgi:hypothetical protein
MAPALAETWVYSPMEPWTGHDVRTLGWPVASEAQPSAYSPVGLLEHSPRVVAELGLERDYRDRNNDAYATRVQLLGLARETEPGATPLAAAVQTDRSRWTYEALDGGVYDAHQRSAHEAASVATLIAPGVALGVGAENDDGAAAPLAAVAIDVAEGLRLDARTLPRRMRFAVSYADNGDVIDTALLSRRQTNEVGVRARVPEAGELSLRMDANEREHGSLRWTFDTIPDTLVRYEYVREENPLASGINLNGAASGEVFGVFSKKTYGLLVRHRAADHDWIGGVRKTTLRLRLNGGVTDDELIDLWAYLLPGERRFAARYAADIVQWFLGRESRASEMWTTRIGLQYVTARASGNFAHWTPIPVLGIGKLDEKDAPLRDERTAGLGVTLGATLRWDHWEFSYGLLQLIPLEQSNSDDGDVSTSASVGARRTAGAAARQSASRGYGGNMQRVQVAYLF